MMFVLALILVGLKLVHIECSCKMISTSRPVANNVLTNLCERCRMQTNRTSITSGVNW